MLNLICQLINTHLNAPACNSEVFFSAYYVLSNKHPAVRHDNLAIIRSQFFRSKKLNEDSTSTDVLVSEFRVRIQRTWVEI